MTALYHEAHVTIDPVREDRRQFVQQLATPWGFKLAKLLMQKGEPSALDTFMTGHGTNYVQLQLRMTGLIKALQRDGLVVRRYKIEDTLMDSRSEDVLGLLPPKFSQALARGIA